MRKYLAVLLGVIFLLSFAVTAFAQDKPEITLGGELRARGWYLDNNATGNLPEATESQAWYDYRVRLNVNANVASGTSGFVQLETSTEKGGVLQQASDWYQWGTFNQKPASGFTLRQAWMQHTGSGLLGVPVGVRIGHVLLALGEKQFFDHTKYGDDAIYLWIDPMKELNVGFVVAKANEGLPANHGDDIDAYMLIGTYKLDKDNTVGLNYTWIKSDAAMDVENFSFQNLGVHANGKFAGFSYAAEFDTQFGKIDEVDEDLKFRGYGVMAKLGYKLDPVGIRASFAMGSGDNNPDDNKIKEFQTTLGRDIHYSFVYEYTVRTAAQNQILSAGATRATGIANTTYYNLGVDFSPMADLNLALDGFIIRATKAIQDGQSKNIGSEIDLGMAYKISKNLTYSVTAGAFWPGKFYTTGDDPLVESKKTVTQAVHALTLSF